MLSITCMIFLKLHVRFHLMSHRIKLRKMVHFENMMICDTTHTFQGVYCTHPQTRATRLA